MRVLTTQSGGAGEGVALLTQQGDALPAMLADPSSIASNTPLSSKLFVDGGNTGTATPDGSIAAPFRTVQAALDAVTIDNTEIEVCYLPGGYLEDLAIGAHPVTIVGAGAPLQQDPVTIRSIASSAASVVALQNLFFTGALTVGAGCDLHLFDVGASGAVNCATLVATASAPQLVGLNGGTVGGTAQVTNYNLQGVWTAVDFVFAASSDPEGELGCAIGTWSCTGNFNVSGGAISTNQSADNMAIRGCQLGQSLTLTCTSPLGGGAEICRVYNSTKPDPAAIITFVASVEGNTILVDAFSNQWMNNSVTATFEFVEVVGALPHVQLSVAVPGVADGAVGYATVSTALTQLAGLSTSDIVVANPTAQLHAAGAGGGYINCRCSASETIELAFIGPLGSQTVDFLFSRLTRAAL